MLKKTLRQSFLEKRLLLEPLEVVKRSKQIQQSLLKHPVWKTQERLGLYSAVKNEVETTLLFVSALTAGMLIYFPKVEKGLSFYKVSGPDDLQKGAWGIPEPKEGCPILGEKEKLDLVVIPGLVFDRRGFRLGYGQGFYDKVIQQRTLVSIALAYDFQVVDQIPTENWDRPVDYLITEKFQFDFRPKK